MRALHVAAVVLIPAGAVLTGSTPLAPIPDLPAATRSTVAASTPPTSPTQAHRGRPAPAADTRTAAPPAGRPLPGGKGPWSFPVDAPEVRRPFDAPPQNWLPGHRGVDLGAPRGTVVRSPAQGRVAFVGMVAGRPVISVDHVDPRGPGVLRSTYEPVTPSVRVGEQVAAGSVLGVVADDSHCAGGCLHWGARVGETYVDPLTLIGTRVRLWPVDQRTG